jgi:transcriptional regulator with XRE-family HTH domain
MSDGQGPATTRRRLRFELRRIREQNRMSQADVSKKLDWSLSKLVRIENGTVGISITDARALLDVYETPEQTVDELVALARAARERRWWSRYRDILSPQHQEFIGFEADAAVLRQFHPTIVPGLLQTEAYMRAVLPALALSPLSESQLEALVEVRLTRQRTVLYADDPPAFTVVVDEGALHRRVGSVEVMRAQLGSIADVARRGLATVAVLPYAAGAHIGMTGAFHIMRFATDVDDDIVYLEGAQGGIALRDQPDVLAEYSRHLDRMLALSATGEDMVAYLARIADTL